MSSDPITEFQQALIDVMRKNGSLTGPRVEAAFRAVPRHLFLPQQPLQRAYADIAIAVREEEGRWTSSSSQPSIMAIMLEQLDPRPGQHVLEIGAGSGFNAALLAYLVGPTGAVTSVDIQPDLVEAACEHLRDAGFGWVNCVAGDGGYGFEPNAPYDSIIITASAAALAPAWRDQLVEGGRLVLPLNLGGPQAAVAFERRGDQLVSVSLAGCGFMPLQGAFAGPQPTWTALESQPGVSVTGSDPLPLPPERLAEWLAAASKPEALTLNGLIPSGIQARAGEIFSNLYTWLSITAGPWFQLSAESEAIDNPLVPPLLYFGSGPEHRVRATALVFSDAGDAASVQGGAALQRAPGTPIPYVDWSSAEPSEPEAPFELYLRPLGPQPQPAARRLLGRLRAWDQAGRPGLGHLQIRAVPNDSPAVLGETRLPGPWMDLLVRFA